MNNFCSAENCTNPPRVTGMCPTHYEQKRLGYGPSSRDDSSYPTCSVSHCRVEATTRKEGALCKPHYQKKWRGIDPETYTLPENHPALSAPPCSEEGCERRSITRGRCDYHRLRHQKTKANEVCSFEGCTKVSAQTGLCQGHYEQRRLTGEMKPLREYGKYVKGELKCPIPACRRPQITQGLCGVHSRMVREYRVPKERLIQIWTNPQCSNPGCTETKRLHMDHNHATGEFRALLCNGCNTALGLLREDTTRISGLREYIERFS